MDGNMVVYHVSDDGTQECYVERGQSVSETKRGNDAASAGDPSQMTHAELVRAVRELRSELNKAYQCINELQQQNAMFRQMQANHVTMR